MMLVRPRRRIKASIGRTGDNDPYTVLPIALQRFRGGGFSNRREDNSLWFRCPTHSIRLRMSKQDFVRSEHMSWSR